MKATGLWDDEAFLRKVMPPEEDRCRIYPSTGFEPRWFRSPNIIPIERHQRFQERKQQPANCI
jgi:hypothetical protein